MDSKAFDYWMAQANYNAPLQQHTRFDFPPDVGKVPSLSGSPASFTYDHFSSSLPPTYSPPIIDELISTGSYTMPMTPSDFGSDHESPYCSPLTPKHAEPSFIPTQSAAPSERAHTTSGRRRAQNRAAQRAFRERKEKHARDLEAQLAALTQKYAALETSYSNLNGAHEKLRRTVGLLVQDDEDDAEGEDEEGRTIQRRSTSSDTLRKLLEILHGEFKGVSLVKKEGG